MQLELLDDRSYFFTLIIYNEDGKYIQVRKNSLEEFIIEDNILDFYHKGYMIMKNSHDAIERQTERWEGFERIPVETFRFRGDARDYMRFELHVNLDSDLGTAEKIESEFYSMTFDFVITHIEDLPAETTASKKKKIYFHDKRCQRLIERDLYWHSGQAAIRQGETAYNRPLSQMSNEERTIRSGLGIKDIIQSALPGSKFSKDWDPGSRPVFYTTPGNSKAIDDLEAMFSKHVSSDDTDNQPSILRLERYSNTWSLSPLSYYFSRAYDKSTGKPGVYQNETFYISAEVDTGGNSGQSTKVPEGEPNPEINVHLPGISEITNYVFSEMPGSDQQTYIVSSPITTYDAKTREFKFYHEKTSITNMYDYFKDTITGTVMGGTSGPHTEFFINNTKKTNKNVQLLHSTDGDDLGVLIKSRNRVMRQALYGGPAILFTIKGSSNRRAGRFIAVDRRNPYEENDFDSKILGQYFVTKVTHRINAEGYSNTIMGSKPYYYSTVEFNNDIN